mmetsp:Transcript_33094/g.54657  ORF Transcript_33094/g.54657 Transcript_33094/m.54657 type:complete len:332 (-) Transcript_33094:269-1264(-)
MAQNPLIGSRISLISKKNIRYEGKLYSINEADATVALQNVKSFGTEGREKTDPAGTFVPPQDLVHPYLVFRGSDIKDLHVHEPPAAAAAPKAPELTDLPDPPLPPALSGNNENGPGSQSVFDDAPPPPALGQPKEETKPQQNRQQQQQQQPKRQPRPRRTNNNNNSTPQHQVGTGASLLNRKARGVVDGSNTLPTAADGDFDFETGLANFEKEDEEGPAASYEKDDFFDSISCDTIDRQLGRDNRLRGSTERTLNTETFGAVALNSNRRYNRRGRGGGRGGRGRGRGRGGGRGRGRGRSSGRYRSSDGGVSQNQAQNNQNTQSSSKPVAAS